MTTTATTEKNDVYRLTMANVAINNALKIETLQGEIKTYQDGSHSLKFINEFDSWSGTALRKVEEICKPMDLVWWISDSYFFADVYQGKARVTLHVAPALT